MIEAANDNSDFITIRGARENNLKNISLSIPHEKFTVITGLSGSGKSTLAFDILFAEGQRRFLDSMSAYARQFVQQMERPDVDQVDGLPPTATGSINIDDEVIEVSEYIASFSRRGGGAPG